jgi:hypothetical protein
MPPVRSAQDTLPRAPHRGILSTALAGQLRPIAHPTPITHTHTHTHTHLYTFRVVPPHTCNDHLASTVPRTILRLYLGYTRLYLGYTQLLMCCYLCSSCTCIQPPCVRPTYMAAYIPHACITRTGRCQGHLQSIACMLAVRAGSIHRPSGSRWYHGYMGLWTLSHCTPTRLCRANAAALIYVSLDGEAGDLVGSSGI